MSSLVNPIRVTRYQCLFCRKTRSKPSAAVAHARKCFKNPNREPHRGELTRFEPHDSMPPWWPGIGKIWDGAAWVDVPGYDNRAGIWPMLDGRPLYEHRPAARIAILATPQNGQVEF